MRPSTGHWTKGTDCAFAHFDENGYDVHQFHEEKERQNHMQKETVSAIINASEYRTVDERNGLLFRPL